MSEVRTVVEDYAADYFVRESLTPRRCTDSLMVLRRLAEFAGKPPEQCSDVEVDAFLTDELARGFHVNTVRFHLNILRPFFKWCWRRRIIDAESYLRFREIRHPRGSTGRARPRPYKRHEIDRFYDALDKRWPLAKPNIVTRFGEGKSRYQKVWRHGIHLQTEAIVSLALFAGMRNAEIRYCDIEDIHPDNDYIVVRGKSGFGERQGYREVPYTEHGREIVARWLDFRELCKPDHDRPWLKLSVHATLACSHIENHPFMAMDKSWANVLNVVGDAWELHRFRHTCATEWLRAGVPIEKIQKLLGHASIQDTQGYLELVRQDVRDSTRKAEDDFVRAVGRRHLRAA